MTEPWDAEALSRRFLWLATEKERYAGEARRKVSSRTDSYKRVHDEALAEFYVANRLHGRTFLNTRQELVDELRLMLAMEFSVAEAFDEKTFKRVYVAEVNRLLKEFELSS